MKTVSNLVAVLILIAIAVGVGMAVGIIVPGLLEKSTPKKGVLSIGGSEVVIDPSSGTVWVTVRGYYEGSEKIQITGVVLSFADPTQGGSSYYIYICPTPCTPYQGLGCGIVSYFGDCELICNSPIDLPGCVFVGSQEGSSELVSLTPLTQLPQEYAPNSNVKILLRGTYTSLQNPRIALIGVKYCFSDGTCSVANEKTQVRTC